MSRPCRPLSVLAGIAWLTLSSPGQAAGMEVTSTSFAVGAGIPALHAAEGICGGQNVSPAVAWSDVPKGTRSIAIVLVDPDGAKGLGVVHWVAYNISAERGELRESEGQKDGIGVTVGQNSAGAAAYRGMCPPIGDEPHHYVMTVIATDLPVTALPSGLTRDELLAMLKGHALQGQSVVGRFGR